MKLHPSKLIWILQTTIYKLLMKKIGFPSYIGNPTYIAGYKRISIGKRVRIFPHIRMEALKSGTIVIEDNVYIGQNCHITSEGSVLKIGEGTNIMANVCITNIDHNYELVGTPVLEQGYTTRKTIIGKSCFIGHGAVIQAGAELGDHVIVGANAVVNRGEYLSSCVLVGAPARIVKEYDFITDRWIHINDKK